MNFFENRYQPDEELEFGVNDRQSASNARLLNEVMAIHELGHTQSSISPGAAMRPMLEDSGREPSKPLYTTDEGSKYLATYVEHNGDIVLNPPI